MPPAPAVLPKILGETGIVRHRFGKNKEKQDEEEENGEDEQYKIDFSSGKCFVESNGKSNLMECTLSIPTQSTKPFYKNHRES